MLDQDKAVFDGDNILVVSVIAARHVEKTADEMRRKRDNGFATKQVNYGVEAYYVVPADIARKCVSTCLFASTVDPRGEQILYMLKDQRPVIVKSSRRTNFGYRESNEFNQNVDALLTIFGRDCPVYHFQFAHNMIDGAAYVKFMSSGEKLVRNYGIWRKIVRNNSSFGNDRVIVNQVRYKPWQQYEPELEARIPAYDPGVLDDFDGFLTMPSKRLGQNESELYEDDGCVELTDAEAEAVLEAELGGPINESVSKVVSARFDLNQDEELAGNVYDSTGWDMLEFQGRVGGQRYKDVKMLFGVCQKVLYFRNRNFGGYGAVKAKFEGKSGFVEFDKDAFQPEAFIFAFDLLSDKTPGDVNNVVYGMKSAKQKSEPVGAVRNADGVELKLDIGNVKLKAEWSPVNPSDVVPAKDAFLFDYKMQEMPKKFVYSAHIESMNHDPDLAYDDTVESDRPLSIKQLFEDLWKRVPPAYGVPADIEQAHKEFKAKVKEIERTSDDKMQVVAKLMSIPFPVMNKLYYGSPDDGIMILPSKEACDEAQSNGIAAGYFENDSATEMKFNKLASDRVFVRRYVAPGLQETEDSEKIKPFFKESSSDDKKYRKIVIKAENELICGCELKKSAIPDNQSRKISESIEVDIPDWAEDYVLYGDSSCMTYGGRRQADGWLRLMESAGWDVRSSRYVGQCGRSEDPAFGCPCDCVRYSVSKRVW